MSNNVYFNGYISTSRIHKISNYWVEKFVIDYY